MGLFRAYIDVYKIPISCGEEIVRARIYSLCSGPQKQFIELIPRVFK